MKLFRNIFFGLIYMVSLSGCSLFTSEPEIPTDLGYAKKYLGSIPYPLRSRKVSSWYGDRNGEFHKGIDFPAQQGTAVFATHPGVVVQSGQYFNGYGNAVVIRDGSFETLYAHLDHVLLQRGRKVIEGDPIGEVGATGHATGNHLHFETRVRNGKGKFVAIDPKLFLKH